VSQQQAMPARIVLCAAEGASNSQVAAEVGVSLPTVRLWRTPREVLGLILSGLDAPWPEPTLSPERVRARRSPYSAIIRERRMVRLATVSREGSR
jgi:hypothetical protein